MAINLVSLVVQYLTPQLVGDLARAVGMEEAAAQKLVSAAIPTILAALASTAAIPDGAEKVSDAIGGSNPDILTIVSQTASDGTGVLQEGGMTLLRALVGASEWRRLLGALRDEFPDAPTGAMLSMIGAVTHSIIGMIGREANPSDWSDGPSIAALLNSQKSKIAETLDPDIVRTLTASGLIAGDASPAELSAPPTTRAEKIFLNYRRDDDAGHAQSLYLRLEREFGSNNLFMDVEGRINPGDDFVEVLNEQISDAGVVLIVIGRRWLDLLSARKGDRDDFNLIEIEAAIAQGKRVIPVLVGGASMPSADSLPTSIQSLARRQAVRLSVDRFGSDCLHLIAAMKKTLHKT